jgi:Holliday junction resolvasome RuvABC endonuclease subunit
MSIGLLAALSARRNLIQVSPIEAKKAATGRKTASKDEMIAWATAKWPHAPWLTKKRHGAVSYTDDNEHLADALAIAAAGVQTVEFRAALQIATAVKRDHRIDAPHLVG